MYVFELGIEAIEPSWESNEVTGVASVYLSMEFDAAAFSWNYLRFCPTLVIRPRERIVCSTGSDTIVSAIFIAPYSEPTVTCVRVFVAI